MLSIPDPLRPYLALIRVVLYLLLVGAIFIGGCQHGKSTQEADIKHVQEAYDGYRAKMVALTQQVAQAAARARQQYDEKSAEALRNYEDGRKSAEIRESTLVADLRAGNVQLRSEWAACMSPARKNQAGPAVGSDDGSAAVPPEAFSRVLRVGDDADLQAAWLQAQLIATRALAESCGSAQ
jgi:hypothetical protein